MYGNDISNALIEDRIIKISGEITDLTADYVMSVLLYLASVDSKNDIQMFINSPGGSVTAGMAIYDCMHHVRCDVSTICMGVAASMGVFLLAGGTKGKRYALPNSKILIHQPLGGAYGQATEIEIAAKHITKTKERLNRLLSENTGQDYKKVCVDTDRDNWLTADEAMQYGLIDAVIN